MQEKKSLSGGDVSQQGGLRKIWAPTAKIDLGAIRMQSHQMTMQIMQRKKKVTFNTKS